MRKTLLLTLLLAGAACAQSDRLIAAALADDGGWKKLEYLCDRIGHRLSGSPQLEEAIRWAAAEMRREGLENVVTPLVMVPHWVRGAESAEMLAPAPAPLTILGLGGSVGTPPEGVTAEVVAVSSFDELQKLGASAVQGKIVLYDEPFEGYGKTVAYREFGAVRAAKLGAVAALVRSVGPVSLNTPHTGMMDYESDVPRIPVAALTLEDATRLHRLLRAGNTVTVRLRMEAKMLPDAPSANVIAELRGSEKPEEIVVMGGHLDSWDTGQGAQDDGAGCVAAWQALVLMKQLGLRPRRTVRVVLWVNEENGLAGGRAYRQWIGDAIKHHVAAIEMDGGSEKPLGFDFRLQGANEEATLRAEERLKGIARLLDGIGGGKILRGGGGADISPLMRDGVPGIGHRTVGERYFEWHHTPADTLDKVNPEDFRKNTAMMAVMAYALADMPERLLE